MGPRQTKVCRAFNAFGSTAGTVYNHRNRSPGYLYGRRSTMASMPKTETVYTEDEYLALERASQERHEYLDGQIYAMAGESLEHGDICMNLSRIVSTSLLGSHCRALSKDTKVRSGPIPRPSYSTKGLYSFPDLVVVCG